MKLSNKWIERRSGNSENRKKDKRDPFERDRARMIHSSSFHRLQAKTKIVNVGKSDIYRTRLTHSLEVAQIGSGIVKHLTNKSLSLEWKEFLPSPSLIETICLAHELGHPPFGHGGEVALNHMMRGFHGFEGNAQTLRIISKLDNYTEGYGMDLTRRAMLGVLKHPVNYSELLSANHKDKAFISENFDNHRQVIAREWMPPKCYFDEDIEVVNWLLEPFSDNDKNNFLHVNKIDGKARHDESSHKSFDTTIMDLSDDIASGIHDLEDAISLKIITKDLWDDVVHNKLIESGSDFNGLDIEIVRDQLFSNKMHVRKEIASELVNWLITSVKVKALDCFDNPLLKYRAHFSNENVTAINVLKCFVQNNVIKNSEVQMLQYNSQQMVMAMFDAIVSDPDRLLPVVNKNEWMEYREGNNCESGSRIVCDYISGMTDNLAVKTYNNLFSVGDGLELNRL